MSAIRTVAAQVTLNTGPVEHPLARWERAQAAPASVWTNVVGVEGDAATSGSSKKIRTGTVGALVAGYALFDVIPIAVIVIGLTAWFSSVRRFCSRSLPSVSSSVNIACCRWLQRHWASWISGSGTATLY